MKDKRLDVLLEHLPTKILGVIISCKYYIQDQGGYFCIKSMRSGEFPRPIDCYGDVTKCEIEGVIPRKY